jgi:hypothetical protein
LEVGDAEAARVDAEDASIPEPESSEDTAAVEQEPPDGEESSFGEKPDSDNSRQLELF